MDINHSDSLFRRFLGANLQTGALRAVLFLAGFAAVGALVTLLMR